jgi:hypothetical protein
MFAANVTPLERLVRLVLGLAIAAFALFALPQASLLFASIGMCIAATGLIGFCPACAIAGRRSQPKK